MVLDISCRRSMTISAESDIYRTIDFEETELRLGLPGSGGGGSAGSGSVDVVEATSNLRSNGKRGFAETEEGVDLKLNLSTAAAAAISAARKLDARRADQAGERMKEKADLARPNHSEHAKSPAAKAQVVGWPPVRSFRKNIMAVQKPKTTANTKEAAPVVVETDAEKVAGPVGGSCSSSAAAMVKVSMDGAPYLRKVDLKLYRSYQHLSDALASMFSSFTAGICKSCTGAQGKKVIKKKSVGSLLLMNGSDDYVATYEDKDGDWMLVGDVPWEMFVDSCRRLRIMKGSERQEQ